MYETRQVKNWICETQSPAVNSLFPKQSSVPNKSLDTAIRTRPRDKSFSPFNTFADTEALRLGELLTPFPSPYPFSFPPSSRFSLVPSLSLFALPLLPFFLSAPLLHPLFPHPSLLSSLHTPRKRKRKKRSDINVSLII